MNRRFSINTIGYAVPQSFITKGKQRLKQHTDTVYLKNGDEFEIELFNPKQNKVLAKIELNGKSIGSGIILRPGERVFLERYLDVAKKFLFETYVVNGNNDEVKNAIANNGVMVQPYIVDHVKEYNSTVDSTLSKVLNEQVCSERTVKQLKQLLVGVVENGTAQNLKTDYLHVAGKTGTAVTR